MYVLQDIFYREMILKGAKENNLPVNYIKFLKTIPHNKYEGEYDIRSVMNYINNSFSYINKIDTLYNNNINNINIFYQMHINQIIITLCPVFFFHIYIQPCIAAFL